MFDRYVVGKGHIYTVKDRVHRLGVASLVQYWQYASCLLECPAIYGLPRRRMYPQHTHVYVHKSVLCIFTRMHAQMAEHCLV